jgi:copper(I)-binding protein
MPLLEEGASTPTNSALYLLLRNRGGEADFLEGGWTSAAAAVELHESRMESGVMRMRRVEAVEVPPGGEAELKPGGLHIMLLDLQAPLSEGDSLSLTLHFRISGDLPLTVPVLLDSGG